jgi:glucose-6-phosphate 1-dehydrogenase
MVARVIPVDPFDLVVFGATGDLARRKILPSLWRRFADGQMPPEARVIGAARSDLTAEEFRAHAAEALTEHLGKEAERADIKPFLERLDYVAIDAADGNGWRTLAGKLRDGVVQAHYFSVKPALFADLAAGLDRNGLNRPDMRVVIEKPFGNNLESARELNRMLARHFDESQIYRIDHYLGKETVQNLMAVRFGNILFEPLWNARFVDHVQITVAEDMGVEGRGEYYDTAGAMRDMVQNHMMQLLCLIAMEPPHRFDPDAVRDEKLKVIRALDPVRAEDIVRGQYRAANGAASFTDEVGNRDSRTESYVALKVGVSSWRWKGTPFYLRTGKRLRARASEIAVTFRDPRIRSSARMRRGAPTSSSSACSPTRG